MQEIIIEIPVKVRYGRTPYTPARTSGPPKNCYPEEGGELEFEIDYEWLDFEIQKAILEHEKDSCRQEAESGCAGTWAGGCEM